MVAWSDGEDIIKTIDNIGMLLKLTRSREPLASKIIANINLWKISKHFKLCGLAFIVYFW